MAHRQRTNAFDPKCVHKPVQDAESVESVFVDQKELSERRWRDQVIAGLGDFLGRYRWHLFLSMDGPADEVLTMERAHNMARRWIRLAGTEAYAYAVFEEGDINGRGHLHLLVGGKINGGTIRKVAVGQMVWRYRGNDFPIKSWNWAHGETEVVVRHVDLYRRNGGAAEYISKQTVKNPEYGQLLGRPRRPRRRKRGR